MHPPGFSQRYSRTDAVVLGSTDPPSSLCYPVPTVKNSGMFPRAISKETQCKTRWRATRRPLRPLRPAHDGIGHIQGGRVRPDLDVVDALVTAESSQGSDIALQLKRFEHIQYVFDLGCR
eukprot:5185936-Pyramimonas_sp.AAC.1